MMGKIWKTRRAKKEETKKERKKGKKKNKVFVLQPFHFENAAVLPTVSHSLSVCLSL